LDLYCSDVFATLFYIFNYLVCYFNLYYEAIIIDRWAIYFMQYKIEELSNCIHIVVFGAYYFSN